MKVSVYSKSWIVLQAETIDEGVMIGILSEHLKATGSNIAPMGHGVMEIPLAQIDEIRFAEPKKKPLKQQK